LFPPETANSLGEADIHRQRKGALPGRADPEIAEGRKWKVTGRITDVDKGWTYPCHSNRRPNFYAVDNLINGERKGERRGPD
jgi:hypothetical protein